MQEDSKKYLISDEFLEDVRRDTKINDLDLRREASTIVNRNQRYIEEYYKENRKLVNMQHYVKSLENELFHNIRKNGYKGMDIKKDSDVWTIVACDEKIKKAIRIMKQIEINVDFLDKTIKNMNNNAWLVQKLIDLERQT